MFCLAQSNLELTRTNWLQAQGVGKNFLWRNFDRSWFASGYEYYLSKIFPKSFRSIEISGNISSLLELAKQNRPDLGVAIAAIKQQEAQLAISYSNSMPISDSECRLDSSSFISPKMPSGYNEVHFLN